MIITGITGQSGSGKTTAAAIFSSLGFYHIDCDSLVHNKVYKRSELWQEIADIFGADCVTPDGLDRKALARLVFSDKMSYNRLMELVMPYVKSQIQYDIEHCTYAIILLDAPLLFEYGLDKMCTHTVGVVADNIIERICTRDGISVNDAKNRLANQKDADFYRSRCDYIIENNGGFEELRKKTREIADIILKGTCT